MKKAKIDTKGKEEALSINKCKNGYMITKGKSMYETPYTELFVFNTFGAVTKHLAKNSRKKHDQQPDSRYMTEGFNTATTKATKDEWLTPPDIIKALGEFDLDPCAPHRSKRPWPTAKHHFSGTDWQCGGEDVCGLREPWNGRVWLNPPYGKQTFEWLAKMATHKRGVALIFARTDTKGFHREIFAKAHSIFFLEGRVRFYHVTGTIGDTPNAASCLISYSPEDTNAIKEAGFKGRMVLL